MKIWLALVEAIPIGLLITVLVIGWRELRKTWRQRLWVRDADPKCRRCGYIVAAGVARTCPECGSDFRAIGIISKSHMRPDHPVLRVLMVLVLFAPVALLLGAGIAKVLPAWWCGYCAMTVLKTGLPGPMKDAPEPLAYLSAYGDCDWRHRRPEVIDVGWWSTHFGRREWSGRLQIKCGEGWKYEVSSMRGAPAASISGAWHDGAFNVDAALDFLKQIGCDPQSPPIQAVARQMVERVEILQRGELPIGKEYEDVDGSMQPAMAYYGSFLERGFVIMIVLWVPVWWLIARRMFARYRQKLAAALAKEQEVLDALTFAPASAGEALQAHRAQV